MDVRIATNDKERNDAYYVRRTVFIEEQKVPEEIEIDEHEKEAIHFVVYDGDDPVGAGRLRLGEGYGKGERICVLASYRKKGVGEQMMTKIEDVLKEKNIFKIKLNAQTHAEKFYQKIGYTTTSDLFYDAGIPHVAMEKWLD